MPVFKASPASYVEWGEEYGFVPIFKFSFGWGVIFPWRFIWWIGVCVCVGAGCRRDDEEAAAAPR